MDASYIYWFTRIGAIESILSLLMSLPLLYLIIYAIVKLLSAIDNEAMPEYIAKFFTPKRTIISVITFFFLVIAIEMVPSKQDLRMMLAVELATEHGIKIQLEK